MEMHHGSANTTSSTRKPAAPETQWEPLTHSSEMPMSIAIRPDATIFDVSTLLSAKLSQLEAMLMATHGETGEHFRRHNGTVQDNFMWSCTDVATECRALFSSLSVAMNKKGGAA